MNPLDGVQPVWPPGTLMTTVYMQLIPAGIALLAVAVLLFITSVFSVVPRRIARRLRITGTAIAAVGGAALVVRGVTVPTPGEAAAYERHTRLIQHATPDGAIRTMHFGWNWQDTVLALVLLILVCGWAVSDVWLWRRARQQPEAATAGTVVVWRRSWQLHAAGGAAAALLVISIALHVIWP